MKTIILLTLCIFSTTFLLGQSEHSIHKANKLKSYLNIFTVDSFNDLDYYIYATTDKYRIIVSPVHSSETFSKFNPITNELVDSTTKKFMTYDYFVCPIQEKKGMQFDFSSFFYFRSENVYSVLRNFKIDTIYNSLTTKFQNKKTEIIKKENHLTFIKYTIPENLNKNEGEVVIQATFNHQDSFLLQLYTTKKDMNYGTLTNLRLCMKSYYHKKYKQVIPEIIVEKTMENYILTEKEKKNIQSAIAKYELLNELKMATAK